MKRLVLDANALISLFDGDAAVAEAMSRAETVLIPAVVLGEVRLGFDGTRRAQAAETALERLLDRANVEVLPVTEETASFFVTIMRLLKKNGTPIPTDDVWIAAGTLESGGVLFTRDRHFDRIPILRTMRQD